MNFLNQYVRVVDVMIVDFTDYIAYRKPCLNGDMI